jgi:1,4-alpha-glucan branching enzyme
MREDPIFALIHGQQHDPFATLGPHISTTESETVVVVRAFLPMAESVTLQPTTTEVLPRQMTRLHPDGVFEALFPGQTVVFPYHLEVVDRNGQCVTIDDPYRFPSTLSEYDLYLMGEGTHYQQYEKFGAHPITLDGVAGVLFIVWAPNARRVSVVGDFNHWDGRVHVMRHHPSNGIWELFLPESLLARIINMKSSRKTANCWRSRPILTPSRLSRRLRARLPSWLTSRMSGTIRNG